MSTDPSSSPNKINLNPTVSLQPQNFTPQLHDPTAKWLSTVLLSSNPTSSSSNTNTIPLTTRDPLTPTEIYDLIKDIRDPEHPLSLSQLNVVKNDEQFIQVHDVENRIILFFTPTVPHCSMSTLIGLCLRVKLLRSLPPRFKVDIYVEPGTHSSELQVNKQLNDKERVAAALENGQLLQVVNRCLS
jgi:hypothetical protein